MCSHMAKYFGPALPRCLVDGEKPEASSLATMRPPQRAPRWGLGKPMSSPDDQVDHRSKHTAAISAVHGSKKQPGSRRGSAEHAASREEAYIAVSEVAQVGGGGHLVVQWTSPPGTAHRSAMEGIADRNQRILSSSEVVGGSAVRSNA